MNINHYITDYIPKDYAGNIPEGELLVDCSLGVSGRTIDREILAVLEQLARSGAAVKSYPHGSSLNSALLSWYEGLGITGLTEDCFIPGAGSYGLLCAVNQLFLGKDRCVLGHSPQFMAYVDSVQYTGAHYSSYIIKKENNYGFAASEYLSSMSAGHDLFIIENPINPTGQAVPLGDIAAIAEKAAGLGRVLVVDEAYGDYLSPAQSALNLLAEHKNIIVTRTFSKAWGMAGMRLGYAVVSPGSGIAEQLTRLALPFQANSIARELAAAAVETKLKQADPFGIEEVRADKLRLRELCRDTVIRIGESCETVPIQLLYTEDERISDLQAHLMKYGILTVSCAFTDGLDAKAVRLMLPSTELMPLLLQKLGEAMKL